MVDASEFLSREQLEDAVKKAFGKVLRQARSNAKRGKVAQETLAYESDYDRTYVHKLENGRNQPSLSAFISLSQHLGVSPITMLRAVLNQMKLPKPSKESRVGQRPRRARTTRRG